MDTLVRMRQGENIKELTREIVSNSDVTYVLVEVDKRDDSILVVKNHSDDTVDKILNKITPEESGYVFFASELDVDPVNNCMVPKHRVATKDEIDYLLDKHVPLNKLPVIRMLDPIRRWHNFPKGSIVAIERPTPDRPSSDTYFRRVV